MTANARILLSDLCHTRSIPVHLEVIRGLPFNLEPRASKSRASNPLASESCDLESLASSRASTSRASKHGGSIRSPKSFPSWRLSKVGPSTLASQPSAPYWTSKSNSSESPTRTVIRGLKVWRHHHTSTLPEPHRRAHPRKPRPNTS